jgi:hypothetical protein
MWASVEHLIGWFKQSQVSGHKIQVSSYRVQVSRYSANGSKLFEVFVKRKG